MPTASLPAACWAFAASSDPVANAARVRDGIAAASRAGARLLLTPECCLTGYPSAHRSDLSGLDAAELGRLERGLADEATRAGLGLLLGTASSWRGGWSNDALLCGAAEGMRYRKRCLTPSDRKHFIPGDEGCVARVDDWRIGLGVCYDLRFPDCWAGLAAAEADAFAVIAHMAGVDPDPGTKAAVIPALCGTRAAEWATPLLFANTADRDRWLDTACWDARGVRVAGAGEGLLEARLERRESRDAWYAQVRADALHRWRASTAQRRAST
jgi:predicted amidohydrolase